MVVYTGYNMPSIDFSPLSKLGDVYDQGRISGARSGLAGAGNVPPDRLAQLLFGAGDLEGGQMFSRLADARAQRTLAQSNADRTFQEGVRQFNITSNKPSYQVLEGDDGNKQIIAVHPSGKANVVLPTGLPAGAPSPYAPTGGKTTDEQTKVRGYVNRSIVSHNVINANEGINDDFGGWAAGVLLNDPRARDSALVNSRLSPQRQQVLQAQRNFVNSVLRRESGAVINPDEFTNAQRQYFPMPGDTPEVLAQKRRNRQDTIEGLLQGTGKGFTPTSSYQGTRGELRGQEDRGQPSRGGVDVEGAVKYLRANPGTAQQFDQIFGAGSAARMLGGAR